VRWLAAIWTPDASALARLDGALVRDRLDDQGRYAAGAPFSMLASGTGELADPARLGARVWAWEVEAHAVIRAATPCPLTMVALTRRRPELSRAEFAAHWTERHAPLARRHHVGLADYSQHVVVRALTADADEVDGIALLGFASRDDFDTRFSDSDAGKEAIRADVREFIAARGGDTTLVGPPRPAVGSG
jgi:uncharacterized protein (TIGR02118 family)